MSRFKKIIAATGGTILFIVLILIGYFFIKYPDVDPPPALTIERTPEHIARGEYLANDVAGCMDCHSAHNWKYFSGPIEKGTEGKGGELYDENFELPGKMYAKNITPAGIGNLTDGELFRIITSGVDKNNGTLFPIMPYPHFNQLSDEDIFSIIAYIRTLKPIPNTVPEHQVQFPVNLLMRMTPTRHASIADPDTSNVYAYGKYLVNAAACSDCHTPSEKGTPIAGMDFAGGQEFTMPFGTVRPANITPDEETGIGSWSEELFIARFKDFATPDAQTLDPAKMKYYTLMPWTFFAGMTERDLSAMYKYLRTVRPVRNQVEKFTPKE